MPAGLLQRGCGEGKLSQGKGRAGQVRESELVTQGRLSVSVSLRAAQRVYQTHAEGLTEPMLAVVIRLSTLALTEQDEHLAGAKIRGRVVRKGLACTGDLAQEGECKRQRKDWSRSTRALLLWV